MITFNSIIIVFFMKRIVIVKFITLFCDQQRVRKLRKYSNEIKKKIVYLFRVGVSSFFMFCIYMCNL